MTTPSLLTRSTHIVDLMIRTDPNILRYRVRGHNTLDGAFFGSVEMFTAEKGRHYRSATLLANGTGVCADTKRGMTRITFDPADFAPLSPSLPRDDEVLFLRVEDYDIAAAGYLPPGQILIIPPPRHFGVQDSTITVTGSAPGGLGALPGMNPQAVPGLMSFGLPLYSTSATIKNLDGTSNLLVSFNKGMPLVPVPPGDTADVYDGSVVEVFLAAEGSGSVDFSGFFSLTKV